MVVGVIGAPSDPKSIDNRSRTKQCHYKLTGIAMLNEDVFIFFFRIALIMTPSNLVPRVSFSRPYGARGEDSVHYFQRDFGLTCPHALYKK